MNLRPLIIGDSISIGYTEPVQKLLDDYFVPTVLFRTAGVFWHHMSPFKQGDR